MDAGRLFGRGIAFPPRIGADGRVAWSEGDVNIRESIRIILMTNLNERLMLPGFGGGLNFFLFEPNTESTRHHLKDRITKALEEWEPRISINSVDVEQDTHDQQAVIVTITYTLVATQSQERVNLSITLKG